MVTQTPDRSRRDTPRSLFSTEERLGRVITREEALALGERLLRMVRSESLGVIIEHNARAVTSVSANQLQGWTIGDELTVRFNSKFGTGWPVSISANQMDSASLQRVVDYAMSLVPPPPPAGPARENPDDPKFFTYKKWDYLPVSLWHDRTARALDVPASDSLIPLVDAAKGAKLRGSATAVIAARAQLYLYQPGLVAWSHETDSELTFLVRNDDATFSAWSGEAARDWGTLSPATIARDVMTLAGYQQPLVAIEPGRRTIILGHAAVAQLVRLMAEGFKADAYGGGPFTIPPDGTEGGPAKTRLGQRVFDARIRMISNPADPEGGYVPFYEPGGSDAAGLPIPVTKWIEAGVLTDLGYNLANSLGRAWNELPHSVRLEAMPGTQTATIEEMIAACQEGVYVNRFAGLSVVDRKSGLMTGTTSDGCFLVKNGKIERPVKNFRFLESPFHAFNRLRMIGVARRAPLGNDSPTREEQYALGDRPALGRWSRWPRVPVIVPPMMIEDFNLAALADAV